MSDAKITKDRVQHHFLYSWWKYALLAVISVFGWNMVYTVTRYQPPPEKRLGIYFVTHSIDAEALESIKSQVLLAIARLEDASCVSIAYTEEDDYYGSIQLSTYVGAGEGDVFIMNRKQFSQYAPSGPFLALDAFVETGKLDTRGIDTQNGYVTVEETGQRVLYGIPAGELYGMMDYGINNQDLLLCVMAYSKNADAAIDCVDWFIETMKAQKPQWLVQMEEEQKREDFVETIPSY